MDMSGRFQPTESFWSVQKSGETVRIPPYQQTQRTVYGQDRYILKSGRIVFCNSGGTVGSLTHLIPFGMEVPFLFYGTDIPKSVNKRNLKKQKGKNYD